MQTTAKQVPLAKACRNNTPPGLFFYDTIEDFHTDDSTHAYARVVERAWDELALNGVLFVDGRPVLYLKEYARPATPQERIHLHRLFWNQGVANILVVADPANVYIYSGLAEPLRDNAGENAPALVETLQRVGYAQQIKAFFSDVATGHYYSREDHEVSFQPDKTVDAYLLRQLADVRNELCDGADALQPRVAHAFLGRLLFVCYLLDRGIVDLPEPAGTMKGSAALAEWLDGLRTFTQKRDRFYAWFATLKDQFNGTMFDQDLSHERVQIRSCHLESLSQFLGGHEVKTRQGTLGFWAYDFRMIPVETISAIYESFLAGEDENEKRKSGAYYTPRFLAEMVLDVATQTCPDLVNKRCLDPACGSGIFLVTLFGRMAETWLRSQPANIRYAARAAGLKAILRDRLCGVDKNETACRIACFSLYLAYLDFFNPPDIRGHAERTGRALPRLLHKPGESNENAIPVIRCADSLEPHPDLDHAFDVVVGNPPWLERPERLAQRFAEKTSDFLKPGGSGCLLLSTKVLLNQTDEFQNQWLRSVALERLVQLADYRHLLFNDAKNPALIACFRNSPPNLANAVVIHEAPKFRRDTLREGCITVSPADRAWIPLREILAATRDKTAPVVWKRHLWGTPRDQKLLDMLLGMPRLDSMVGRPEQKKQWHTGQGFQPLYLKEKDVEKKSGSKQNPWPENALFVNANGKIDLCLLEADCELLGVRLRELGAEPRRLRRCPNATVFKSPMVLVSQGFGKVAFCDFDVVFQDSLQSISGPPEDTTLLLFLAAYLRSPVAKYFLFHTAANWGTERDKVHLYELLRLPFPLPGNDDASPKAARIVEEASSRIARLRADIVATAIRVRSGGKHRDLVGTDEGAVTTEVSEERKRLTDTAQDELNQLVYKYFGLTDQEIMLVEDTVRISIPSSTPSGWWRDIPALQSMSCSGSDPSTDLATYADTLTATLNTWATEMGSNYRTVATGGVDNRTGLAMVTLSLANRQTPFVATDVASDLWDAMDAYRKQVGRQRNGTLTYDRDVVVFVNNRSRIHIVRPGILANWTRTAALNDAARLYGEIVSARGQHG